MEYGITHFILDDNNFISFSVKQERNDYTVKEVIYTANLGSCSTSGLISLVHTFTLGKSSSEEVIHSR